MQPRHQQLFDALVQARRAHGEKPCESTHLAKRAAVRAVHEWLSKDQLLTSKIQHAEIDGEVEEAARLKLEQTEHRGVIDPRDVKLVDTAGVLRLDMNGHRVFMNHEQGRKLFALLGAVLYSKEYSDLSCDYAPDDTLRIAHDRGGRCAEVMCIRGKTDDDGEFVDVTLSAEKALKAAIAIAAVSEEVRKDGN